MEPFRAGEPVTLREGSTDTIGRIVGITEDGRRAEVQWHTRPGHMHESTVEELTALRRLHESEAGMA